MKFNPVFGALLGLLLFWAGLTILLIAWKNGDMNSIQAYSATALLSAGSALLWEDVFKPLWTKFPGRAGGKNA